MSRSATESCSLADTDTAMKLESHGKSFLGMRQTQPGASSHPLMAMEGF